MQSVEAIPQELSYESVYNGSHVEYERLRKAKFLGTFSPSAPQKHCCRVRLRSVNDAENLGCGSGAGSEAGEKGLRNQSRDDMPGARRDGHQSRRQ
ncbi:hypothetical protein NDU88_001262 [Pleurodeles waltl]|uniref:Uncharacterized protein n=1 Tax=Pleurodeles waltl TaxID=8319 RepID=A0AAV7SYR4_PLEWA|nr:hypothetical protein NDU88_001262 [Pleurodeles waltl]